jgi:hypothetical protein
MNKKFFAAGLAVAAALGMGIKPAVADTIGVTVVPGQRSASITDLVLPPVVTEHAPRMTAGTVTLWADDSSGTNAGWNVTVKASNFTGPQALPASALSALYSLPAETIAGQPVDEVNGPQAVALASGTLETPRVMLSAQPGYGKGTYSEDIGLALLVPADTLAGTYSTTLTVSITAGP